MVSLSILKFCCVIILLTLNSLSGLISFFFSEKKSKYSGSKIWRYLFSFSNCFSVGLFLGIALLGLYGNANMRIEYLQLQLSEGNLFKEYPLPELILCVGIFFLCASEWTLRTSYSFFESYVKSKRVLRQTCSEAYIKLLDVQGNCEGDSSDIHPELMSDSNLTKMHGRRQLKPLPNDGFSFLKSLFVLYAMSFHSVLEAVSFGLLESVNQIVSMVLAMALHQALCAGTLGFRLAHTSTSRTSRCLALVVLSFYLLILPSGTFIGAYLHARSQPLPTFNSSLTPMQTNSSCQGILYHSTTFDPKNLSWNITVAILQILAAASFLYVVFIEMVPLENADDPKSSPELIRSGHCSSNKPTTPLEKFICFSFAFSGFILVSGLRFLHYHQHP